jgi:RNA polymerase sigma factor for flagellar operon FliA
VTDEDRSEGPPADTLFDSAEAALWSAFKRDQSSTARETLFLRYLPFATTIAKRHFFDRTGGDIEYADLRQLACAGLLEAIDGYEPGFGTAFTAYAGRRIAGSIVDGISKTSEVREQISFRKRVRTERARSLVAASPAPVSATDAIQALADLAVGLALGYMLEGTALYASEDQSDTRVSAYESLALKETIARVLDELSKLPEREGAVMRHHYLTGLTFDQIGALLGVTKGRVSQIHRSAIERLRKRMPRTGDFHLER